MIQEKLITDPEFHLQLLIQTHQQLLYLLLVSIIKFQSLQLVFGKTKKIIPFLVFVLMSIELVSVAPKRKRPRQVLENPGGFGVRNSPISSTTAKVEMDQTTMRMEVFSPNLEKTPQSAAENGVSLYDLSASVQSFSAATDPMPEPMKVESEVKRRPEESEFMESKEEVNSPKRESFTLGADNSIREDAAAVAVTQV